MRRVTLVAVVLGLSKLCLSASVLAFGYVWLGLGVAQLQTLTFATLVLGNQGMLYVVRERGRLWHSRPGAWVVASSAFNVAFVFALASAGIFMAPLPWQTLAGVLLAALAFALVLDQVKLLVTSRIAIE
jgi:H+-transporting ATPase